MKKYTVKPNEDLGAIARKFGMPSWKYLYEINKDVIGENPDLLKDGTKLQIPQWDSTKGDEKIKEKGAEPFEYVNGLRYAYPWAPFSLTLTKGDDTPAEEFSEEREIIVENEKTGERIKELKIKSPDTLELLIPDSSDITVGIKDYPLMISDKIHRHPDNRGLKKSKKK